MNKGGVSGVVIWSLLIVGGYVLYQAGLLRAVFTLAVWVAIIGPLGLHQSA